MFIKYNIINFKRVICHKLTSDGSALATKCGRDEDYHLNAIAH